MSGEKTPGQRAREAFGELGADWYPGTPWDELHEDLRAQWEAAAQAVLDDFPLATQAVRERDAARAAARYFAETWAELITALPDDYDCTMNCGEANAAADLYRALGDEDGAAAVIAAHAAHDEDGDQHYQDPAAAARDDREEPFG